MEAEISSRLGVKSQTELMDNCISLCEKFNFTAEKFETKWRFYCHQTGCEQTLSQINLDKLTQSIISSISTQRKTTDLKKATPAGKIHDKNSIQQLNTSKSDFSSHFGVNIESQTPERSAKRAKSMASASPSLGLALSSAISSPATHTPTPSTRAYSVRQNRNQIELTYPPTTSLLQPLSLFNPQANIEDDIVKLDTDRLIKVTCLDRRLLISESNPSHASLEGFRYLYPDLNVTADMMSSRVQMLAHEIASANNLDSAEFQAVDQPALTTALTYGRIVSESSDGRLNAASVLLEGDDARSQGRRVTLDLSELNSYALFPGQTVVVEGINPSGRRLIAKQIHSNGAMTGATTNAATVEAYSRPLTVLAVAGPFHLCPSIYGTASLSNSTMSVSTASPSASSGGITKDASINSPHPSSSSSSVPAEVTGLSYRQQLYDLDFAPLADLIQAVQTQKPDILIMIGPFLDSDAAVVRSLRLPYAVLFRQMLEYVCSELQKLAPETTVILVPSTRDIQHHLVFPQPPFEEDYIRTILKTRAVSHGHKLAQLNLLALSELQKKAYMYLLPNPCTVRINDIVFGIVAEDIFFDLSKNLIIKGFSRNQDRITPSYLFDQQSFYPKYPSDEKIPFDFTYANDLHFKQLSPDILITPSKLVKFVKVVESRQALCINPERLVKSETAGTFAFLTIHPLPTATLDTNDSTVATIDAVNNEPQYYHRAASRTRVDIVRI